MTCAVSPVEVARLGREIAGGCAAEARLVVQVTILRLNIIMVLFGHSVGMAFNRLLLSQLLRLLLH